MSDFDHPAHDSMADAHGQAALVAVESLIHGLAASSLITLPQAVAILEVAFDAQVAIADDAARPKTAWAATALLARMIASLKTELP